MNPRLSVRDLRVDREGRRVLEIPELDLDRGQVLALIGPNGAGKSTLLLSLASLLPFTSGRLAFDGQPVSSSTEREAYRRRVTLVFQEPLLFDTTVAENLASGLRLRGMPRAARATRVREAAERFGIAPLLQRPARALSGGEAQRTSLARAFALKPELILLDEPFSALDPPTRERLIEDLGRVLRAEGCTAVFATHDQGEALSLADEVAVLNGGRLAQRGPMREVINHPADAFLASFVGMETVVEGRVCALGPGTFTVQVGERPLEAVGEARLNQAVLVGIRPENVTLGLHEEHDTSARNAFPGTVLRVLPRGAFYRVELDCGFFLCATVTARSLEDLDLRPGRTVVASFKATAVHVIRQG